MRNKSLILLGADAGILLCGLGILPHQIKAAVAYMSPYRLVSFKMEAGGSSSHAPALRVPLDAGKDGTVAPDDHAPEPVLIQAALML